MYSSNLFSIKSSVRAVKKQFCVPDHAAHPISCGGQSLPKRCKCKIKGSPAFSKMQFFPFLLLVFTHPHMFKVISRLRL